MTDIMGGERRGVGEVETSVVDVDIHEMLTSIRDLVPYLEEPWRSRIAINDGFKGPAGNPTLFRSLRG